jgi:hypothetical protein
MEEYRSLGKSMNKIVISIQTGQFVSKIIITSLPDSIISLFSHNYFNYTIS